MNQNGETQLEDNQGNENDVAALFERLTQLLDGVIPDDIFDAVKDVRPLEDAVTVMLRFGGRIRLSNPEIDLSKPYDYPKDLEMLNGEIGSFTFQIAPTPFIALALAAHANIDADMEVITSCDLRNLIPLIISESGNPKRICLINYQDRKLQLPMQSCMKLSVDMSGDTAEQKAAMDEVMEEFGQCLEDLKQQMTDPPQTFDSPEEEQAVVTWCDKHSYKYVFLYTLSLDRYF